MFTPLDMVQAAGGPEMQAMARQFGLTVEQTQRAFQALMPALTLGLQRGSGLDPTGLARMFTAPDMARAAAPQGLDALGQMFGSAQLMQAVLQQASAASGVQSQVLRQMLPMMAGAVVASIVHVVLNQPQAEPARPAAPAPPPAAAASALPFVALWTDMARAFMTPPPAPASPAPRPEAAPPPSRPQVAAPPPPQPEAPDTEGGADMLSQMLRTGAEVQEQNLKAMQQLFEAFWPGAGAKPVTPAGEASARASAAPRPGPAPREPRPAPRARRGRPGEGA
ncbi:DUF937 domain-containing protein [Methylobacterium aerolatum]|uniref:DUF937 domain-containing protein n=1 Tax=Methylobacterium aerolatum TaxID=418708 RepID=A0ABU0HWI1_9HYPH|nr:DUF937 domain-containing protein [Methylobacterium aerolatum]MDQ0446247.1 hypothetical protein [Methylobacterium aerolatum]GJD35590.1 hypothetical protein FMGBMHLM_2502 [Methylobacterium aerolatum]